jgi:mono/diheme cytochrome c family protein
MRYIGMAAAVALAALTQAATAADVALNETQTLGRRLFEQSCGVCHTRVMLTARVLYGPELSRETAGGNEEVVRGVISNGTPRMPAFKYMFDQTQIAAIASYLKTVPPGTQAMLPSLARPAR